MFKPDSLILYCDDVNISTEFYQTFLKAEPIERFEGFSVFQLDEHFILGLQDKHSIAPEPEPAFGGFEISMGVAERVLIEELFKECTKLHIPVALPPTELEFGYTFVVLDPDGHRLRICATDTTDIQKFS